MIPGLPRPDLAAGERVGVYGGSFDPIHRGHVDNAVAALDQARLSRILFLPTADPPHKRDARQAPALRRFAMAELAVVAHRRLLVQDDEMVVGPRYTVETLEALEREFPGVEFLLLMGSDSYRDLPDWRSWREIVERWDLVVLPRPGSVVEPPREVGAVLASNPARRHHRVEGVEHEASSTEIRRRLSAGEDPPAGWVPGPVLDFVRKYDLYRGPESVVDGEQPSPSTAPGAPVDSQPSLGDSTISSAAEPQDHRSAEDATAAVPPHVAAAARVALDRKAEDLLLLDVSEVCDFADWFLIGTGNSDRQVGAVADGIQRTLREMGERPIHIEGETKARWVLLDYGDLIAHVFDRETRDFYRLERLWNDAPRVRVAELEAPVTGSSAVEGGVVGADADVDSAGAGDDDPGDTA